MRFPELRLLGRSKTLTVVRWGLATILLGALGSGLWNILLSRVFDWTSRTFLEMLSFLFASYVDVLHREIGQARQDMLAVPIFILIMSGTIIAPWALGFILLERIKHLQSRIGGLGELEKDQLQPDALLAKLTALRRKVIAALTLVASVVSFIYALQTFQVVYTRKAVNFVERSIDILAPHIAQKTVLELRAAYRAVNNAKKFYELEDKLKAIARDARVSIPPFSSIRSARSAS